MNKIENGGGFTSTLKIGEKHVFIDELGQLIEATNDPNMKSVNGLSYNEMNIFVISN